MPARLRPTAAIASAALLVGDPGRALALAQEVLEAPKMSNHARGLWGYTGTTAAGRELTIQATGIGGPSARVVLDDLHELGVRRAIRVGTAVGIDPSLAAGSPLVVAGAREWRHALGDGALEIGPHQRPDPALFAALVAELGQTGSSAEAASLENLLEPGADPGPDAAVADMQTAAILARATQLGIDAAAVLIVAASATGERLNDEVLEAAAKLAGRAAATVLLTLD